MKPRLIFFGTPDFAVPSLRALLDSGQFEVCGAVTQPDKPAGRGLKLQPPPVKVLALERGLAVHQPETLRGITFDRSAEPPALTTSREENSEFVEFLRSVQPVDALIVVAYGNIIPGALLDYPAFGAINIHASLLPRWRGAAPLQAAIFHGDEKTGVCLMEVSVGLDKGAVYCSAEYPLNDQVTFGELHDGLAALGAQLLSEKLGAILRHEILSVPQAEDGATYAEKWEAGDCAIDWEDDAEKTLRRIRASSPVPGARTSLDESIVKIFSARLAPALAYPAAPPGMVVEVNPAQIIVAAGTGQYIALEELQLAGKKRLPAAEIIRGRGIKQGDIFEPITVSAEKI